MAELLADPGSPSGASAAAAVGFVRLLRHGGLRVATGHAVVFAEALIAVNARKTDDLYWAARATLCHRPEDRERFDECFRAWFGQRGARVVSHPEESLEAVLAFDAPIPEDDAAVDGSDREDTDAPVLAVRFSNTETLRERDFAIYSRADHLEARRALSELRVVGESRRSRRLVQTRARRRPDVRRTVRAAMRTHGEPLARLSRTPSTRARRLVLLCDVSGSMEPYSRVIVRFVHSAVVARTQVEAFALGTRLTRITRELANRDPDAAIASAARRVADWSGGTRLGETLRTFNDSWGVRGMARGAVVVIISDGWDRGEPEMLAAQMERLHRVAHRVVWVNPLKASPGYAPIAAGMAAALPFVDDFVAGHSLASLSELVDVIAQSAGSGGVHRPFGRVAGSIAPGAQVRRAVATEGAS